MAFAQWQADPSDENAQALDDAEAARSQAEINSQQAKEAYEDKKVNQPKMPDMQITVTVRTAVRVICLQMEQKVPVRVQQIREVAQQRL